MTEGGVGICCITGSLHEGTPKGTEGTVGGLPTYIAKPPSSATTKEGIIVIIPDIFGWKFGNNQLLADEYAERSGRTVYLPDFMNGDLGNPGFLNLVHPIDGSHPSIFQKIHGYAIAMYAMIPWFYRHRQAVTLPIVKSFFQTLKKEKPNTKIGVAGFCWGGRYAMLLGQDRFAEEQLVDAVFAGHPSLVSIPSDVEHLSCPQSIAVAGEDSVFSPKMAEQVKKIWAKFEDIKTEFVIYDGAQHSFCVRGNMKDGKEREHMEKGIEQAVNWFDTYLS